LCPSVHGFACDINIFQKNLSLQWFDKTDNHIKGSGFARTVWAKQAYNLSLIHLNGNIINNRALTVLFDKILGTKYHANYLNLYDNGTKVP
jgi:hypothetical protein